jgi:hypothetical protein
MGRQAPLVTVSVEPHEEHHKAEGMVGNSQVEPATTASPASSGLESNGIALACTAVLPMLRHKIHDIQNLYSTYATYFNFTFGMPGLTRVPRALALFLRWKAWRARGAHQTVAR